jgi:hypothetical protein
MKILIITCNHYFRQVFSTLSAFYLTRNGKTQLFWTDYWKYEHMRPFGSILSWHYCIYEKTTWIWQVKAGDSVCLELYTYRACRKESVLVQISHTTHQGEKKRVVAPAMRSIISLLLISFISRRYVSAGNEQYRASCPERLLSGVVRILSVPVLELSCPRIFFVSLSPSIQLELQTISLNELQKVQLAIPNLKQRI